MTPLEKVQAMDNSSVNDVHEDITLVSGIFTAQLQVGHPGEEGSYKGCFPAHLLEAVTELFKHYNEQVRCRETSITITKLEEALLWQEKRRLDRTRRNVLQTDKE